MPTITALSSSPWATIVLGVISVTGLVLTVVFYGKSRRFKMPLFRVINMPVVGDKTKGIDGLLVNYNGANVSTFSVARFAIWNAGNEAINAGDLAPSDPLRIAASGETDILDARISYVKKKANNFRVSVDEDKKYVAVGFDYFHRSEGLVIEIYHTGASKNDLQIKGTIKGIDSFKDAGSIESKYMFGWLDVLHAPFKWVKNEKTRIRIVFCLASVTFPISAILILLDGLRRSLYRPAKEYELRD